MKDKWNMLTQLEFPRSLHLPELPCLQNNRVAEKLTLYDCDNEVHLLKCYVQ